ncbi:acetyltransferase, GNAT family [Rhodobacteraceae bacterium KLH11]|nr:acetyltransferase, GNAT family [Rhodobacteraceae bacterium KLH11]
MSELTLRAAVPDDAEAIRACLADAYAQARRDIPDLPDVTAGIQDDINAHEVVVAEAQGRLLGVIVFGQDEEVLMIFNLGVSPHAQGRGVARRLLGAAEVFAAAAGLSTLCLRTHRLMKGTRAMYRHLGWQEVEARGNIIRMEKPVT